MDIKHLPLYFHVNAESSATGEKLLASESSFLCKALYVQFISKYLYH